jgi:hypothetical protein
VGRQLTNNNIATDSCWIFIGSGTATKGTSILLPAGASYRREWRYVQSDQIQTTCATTFGNRRHGQIQVAPVESVT